MAVDESSMNVILWLAVLVALDICGSLIQASPKRYRLLPRLSKKLYFDFLPENPLPIFKGHCLEDFAITDVRFPVLDERTIECINRVNHQAALSNHYEQLCLKSERQLRAIIYGAELRQRWSPSIGKISGLGFIDTAVLYFRKKQRDRIRHVRNTLRENLSNLKKTSEGIISNIVQAKRWYMNVEEAMFITLTSVIKSAKTKQTADPKDARDYRHEVCYILRALNYGLTKADLRALKVMSEEHMVKARFAKAVLKDWDLNEKVVKGVDADRVWSAQDLLAESGDVADAFARVIGGSIEAAGGDI
jgi:hypothetical protein